ncbi:hypothetical protein COT42_08800 [Candidatus Saganbacteria bacterium CG08_land_8_20_14_0_20_45_16]|uniref:Uncharacterized protein n=1 Tax=Candidatus Saganbacteria bacterium CG08_land_8_20_14_0_20_45_16 TaxID=2014293 RepID=A0A2H0XTT3_UNCSA|nr:MAG: hypothetical protein COT42_08800 [Candidatus Saganbacteria bacterium CG08_land_8_20_14_0_20_45_16]
MPTIKNFLSSLKEKDKYPYYKEFEVLANETNLIKFRLYIHKDLFVQIYHNENSAISSFALVSVTNRIFGRDKIGKRWHRHPTGNSSFHDDSPKGNKSTNIKKFLAEVNQILKELKLI